MATYLLLRNNQQLGPFNFQELIDKGLKPYDLIWVENKSAAWRYASEVDELKAFSPAIEEQPFDRFYKNGTSSSSTELNTESFKKNDSFQKDQLHISVILPQTNTKKNGSVVGENAIKKTYQSYSTSVTNPVTQVGINKKEKLSEKEIESLSKANLASAPFINHKKNNGDFKFFAGMGSLLFVGILIGWSLNQFTISNKKAAAAVLNSVNTLAEKNIAKKITVPASTQIQNTSTDYVQANTVDEKNIIGNSNKIADVLKNKVNKKPQVKKTITPNNESNVERVAVSETKTEKKTEPVIKPIFKGSLNDLITVSQNKFKTATFGGINDLQISVKNKSDYTLDEIIIKVDYILNSDRIFKIEYLHFKTLAPGSSNMLEAPKSSRGTSIRATINTIKSNEVVIIQ